MWVELLFEGYAEWYTDCEGLGLHRRVKFGVAFGIRDGLGTLRGLWFELCVGWLGPQEARVRARPPSQSPENQSVCCNVSTDFEDEIVIKNTFLQVVRKEPSRPRAEWVPSWCRPKCINECVVEVPVPHFREETEEVMYRVTVVKSVDDGEAWPPEFAN